MFKWFWTIFSLGAPDKIRRAQANEEKSPRKLHTIPYNKIIRNCMELSGVLTVQALCVFSCGSRNSKETLEFSF